MEENLEEPFIDDEIHLCICCLYSQEGTPLAVVIIPYHCEFNEFIVCVCVCALF